MEKYERCRKRLKAILEKKEKPQVKFKSELQEALYQLLIL